MTNRCYTCNVWVLYRNSVQNRLNQIRKILSNAIILKCCNLNMTNSPFLFPAFKPLACYILPPPENVT